MAVAITSITPPRGRSGDSVVIDGSGFNATMLNNTVTFNGQAATVTGIVGTTQLTVTVPGSLGTSDFQVPVVVTNTGDATSATRYWFVLLAAADYLTHYIQAQQPGPAENVGAEDDTVPEAKDYERLAAFIEAIRDLLGKPTRFVEGLLVRYTSATAIVVSPGSCRNKADTADMTLAADQAVSITTSGAGGLVTKAITATASTTNGSAIVTASAPIISDLGTRALTGTISSSGAAVTGTGTKFLAEVAVGDMIGASTTYGYARVTAIASDTALTVVAAFPGGNAAAGTAVSAIENVVIRFTLSPTPAAKRLNTISAAGTALVCDSTHNDTEAGVAMTAGDEIASCWYAVWLCSGGSGTSAILSTQRTTPYLPTGYDTSYRRVGWVRNYSTGDFLRFTQEGDDRRRITHYIDQANTRILAAGAATAWAAVEGSTHFPPTSRVADILVNLFNPAVINAVQIRSRGIAGTGASAQYVSALAGERPTGYHLVQIDGAQVLEYQLSAADANSPVYLDVIGYQETL